MKNRLYSLKLALIQPVYLLSKGNDHAWLWHVRYGHLNFISLLELGAREMVEGLPVASHAEQICDSCATAKQHHKAFPNSSTYRAKG